MKNQTLLVSILCVVVFGVGFLMGNFTAQQGVSIIGNGGTEEASESTAESADNTDDIAIDSSSLTDGQRKLISSFGLDPDNMTISAEMVACAEAKFGAARIEEFKNGASPSLTEKAGLVACYK